MQKFVEAAQAASLAEHGRRVELKDAVRRYARLLRTNQPETVLMDWPRQPDGPPIRQNLPYSQIAHLAEDVVPFVAVANGLRRRSDKT